MASATTIPLYARQPAISSGRKRLRSTIGSSNRREFTKRSSAGIQQEDLDATKEKQPDTTKNSSALNETVEALTNTGLSRHPNYWHNTASSAGRDINIVGTPFSDETTFATKHLARTAPAQRKPTANLISTGEGGAPDLKYSRSNDDDHFVFSTVQEGKHRRGQRSQSNSPDKGTLRRSLFGNDAQNSLHLDSLVVNSGTHVPTRNELTDFHNTMHLTTPDPGTALWKEDKERLHTSYQSMIGEQRKLFSDETQAQKLRYSSRLQRRCENESRVLNAYQQMDEKAFLSSQRRVIGYCKSKINYLEALATVEDFRNRAERHR